MYRTAELNISKAKQLRVVKNLADPVFHEGMEGCKKWKKEMFFYDLASCSKWNLKVNSALKMNVEEKKEYFPLRWQWKKAKYCTWLNVLNYLAPLSEWHHFMQRIQKVFIPQLHCSSSSSSSCQAEVSVGDIQVTAAHQPEHTTVRKNKDHLWNWEKLELTGECVKIPLWALITL